MIIPKTQAKSIEISKLHIDEKIHSRDYYDEAHLESLEKAYSKNPDTIPPIHVVFDGQKHILSDGFYRIKAAKKLNQTRILAYVLSGETKDAIMNGCKMNNNKLRPEVFKRSNKCKKKAVMIWMKYVDRRISSLQLSELIGVSCPTVTKIRQALQEKERKQSVKKINLESPKQIKNRKKSSLPVEIKKAFGNLKREIEIKKSRQWNSAIKDEILLRLSGVYSWVEKDLKGE